MVGCVAPRSWKRSVRNHEQARRSRQGAEERLRSAHRVAPEKKGNGKLRPRDHVTRKRDDAVLSAKKKIIRKVQMRSKDLRDSELRGVRAGSVPFARFRASSAKRGCKLIAC